jgi:peptide/nickel transport system substrate-binding protein
MIELEANPDYYRGKPEIEHLILKLGEGDPVIELKSGNVDLAVFGTVADNDIPVLEMDPNLKYYWRTANGVSGLAWNLRDPILADRRVRQAIAYAVDRTEMAAALDLPPEVTFRDVPLTWNQRLRGESPPPLPFDPERSRQLLEEAGWRDVSGDGIREKNGQPLSIEAQTGGGGMEMLVVLQAQMLKIGVRLDIVPNAAIRDVITAIRRGQPAELEGIQAVFSDWGRCPHHFPILLGHPPDRESAFGYRNDALIDLNDAMDLALVPGEVDELCRGTWPILQEDQPFLFLLPGLWLSAAHKRVRGLQNGTRVWISSNITDLWMGEDGPADAGSGQGGGS